MDLQLKGRRAAVAAASRGLGFATAAALAAEGADVAICSRSTEAVRAAAERIGATPLVADVGDPQQAGDFVARAREALGGLDILITNAGGPPPGEFDTTSVEAFQKALSLGLLSVVAMCHEAVPGMRAHKWGRIVAITSISARQPLAGLITGNTSRAGVTGFLKTLALEVAADGVTVNSIQPGFHDTERARSYYADRAEAVAASLPAGRMGAPEDFGAVAAFLCSEQAGYMTGAALHVDGGMFTGLQ